MAKARTTKNAKPARSAAPIGEERHVAQLLEKMRADSKLQQCVREFDERAIATSGRTFGSNGLKANGKLFALFTQGTLVVKLPKDRVAALVASRVGEQFDPGHGRLMKEWLTVRSTTASWIDLAREAHDFVTAASRTARGR